MLLTTMFTIVHAIAVLVKVSKRDFVDDSSLNKFMVNTLHCTLTSLYFLVI